MSTNAELAKIFNEMAAVLEITGANAFKVNAHTRVARLLKDMTTDIAELADEKKKLTALDGIGDGSAKKIMEYVETGTIAEHQELLDAIPKGLLDVMKIPGLGPKTVKLMWDDADVVDLKTLKKQMDAGVIEKLPRMGAKTVANIRDAIAFSEKSGGRIRLDQALPIAEAIVETLKEVPGVQQMQYAGSLRRGRETIGDIDILASTKKPKQLAKAFQQLDGVTKVLAAGETKSSVRIEHGPRIVVQADLRIVDDNEFGAALLYFTGSKEHNVKLRERAIKQDQRLNEYGLFPEDDKKAKKPPQRRGVKPVAAKTEESIYNALDLPYIAPESREDRGELDSTPPDLIELADIKAELHAHTVASDGKMTIEELVVQAKQRGYHTICVTDHSKSSAQAGGLSVERLLKHIDAVKQVDADTKGITVLAGSEVDILVDGRLDYDDELLAKLDIVVASPHASLRQDSKKATKRLLAAINHPLVHVLGHPTGRVINRREGLSPDISALVEAAAETDTALEINANPLRLDLRDTHVRAAIAGGALIAIDTDTHIASNFDLLRYGVLTARRGGVTKKTCVNAWTKTKLHKWIKSKR